MSEVEFFNEIVSFAELSTDNVDVDFFYGLNCFILVAHLDNLKPWTFIWILDPNGLYDITNW